MADEFKDGKEEISLIMDCEITIKVSAAELKIIEKKATSLGMDVGELMRVYVLKTAAFDASVFDKTKGKNKMNNGENAGGVV